MENKPMTRLEHAFEVTKLKRLLELDPTPTKPKLIQKNKQFTKAFLKWNRQKITEGVTTFYANRDAYVNSSGREVQKIYSRNRIETKASRSRPQDGSLLIKASIDFRKTYKLNSIIETKDFLYNIVKKNKLFGELRLILTTPPTDNLNGSIITYEYGNIVEDVVFSYNGENAEEFFRKNPFILLLSSEVPNIIPHILELGVEPTLYITKSVELTSNVVEQVFRNSNKNDCLLLPMYNYYEFELSQAKTKANIKRFTVAVNKFKDVVYKNKPNKLGLFSMYPNGVPENCVQSIADTLQCKIKIDKPLGEKTFIECIPNKKATKVFNFIMTRDNHVERLTTTSNQVPLSAEGLLSEVELYQSEQTYFTFNKGFGGYTNVSTIDTNYVLDCPYNETKRDWMEGVKMEYVYLDAIKFPEAQDFINRGVHFNTTIDFKERTEFLDTDIQLDQKKAYTQFHTSKYYKGFLGKITDLRPIDNHKQIGYYYIENVDLKNCTDDFKFINSKLKWIQSNNIYFSPELDMFIDNGVTFVVTFGCYGMNYDFRFDSGMINNKKTTGTVNGVDIKIPYYSLWTGCAYRLNYEKKVCVHGSKTFLEQLVLPPTASMNYDTVGGYGTIYYKKEVCNSLRHIVGGITAYQRLSLMEQLLKMQVTKLIRVCVDAIYSEAHEVELLPSFEMKTKFTLKNAQAETYLSNMEDYTNYETTYDVEEKDPHKSIDTIYTLPEFIKKLSVTHHASPFYKTELILGPGGCGKTYTQLNQNHIGLLYVAPCNNLCANVKAEYKDKSIFGVTNLTRFMEQPYCEDLHKHYNTVIIDEVSMISNNQKLRLLEMCKLSGIKCIFMGDVGYQLEGILMENPQFNSITKESTKEKKAIWNTIRQDIKKDRHCLISEIPRKDILNVWKSKGLDTYLDEEFKIEGFENIQTLTVDRRASKCPTLQLVKRQLREFIDTKLSVRDSRAVTMRFLRNFIDTISDVELGKIYKSTDFILASTHNLKDKYTEQFRDIEKYRINNNTRLYQNGSVVYTKPIDKDIKYNLQHAFTIHSIQGTTVSVGNNLYINPNNMFSVRSMYTAISRAKTISQIKFLN